MKCPHCQVTVHLNWAVNGLGADVVAQNWILKHAACPACLRFVFQLARTETGSSAPSRTDTVWPRVASRPAAPPEVPAPFSTDYHEACLVLIDSPKASAALSRRCLRKS